MSDMDADWDRMLETEAIDSGDRLLSRAEADAADRIFESGILDEIYEDAYQHGKRGRVVGKERNAMDDAETIARLALEVVAER